MSNSNKSDTKCPDCNCPKCPEQQKCPDQITMQDIVKAVMPGKSPFYTFGEFHMNGKNIDSELLTDATDRWEGSYMFNLQPGAYNPSSQGIMPYSGAIRDEARPYKLDSVEDMFNLEEAIDTQIDIKLVDELRIPGASRNTRNGMASRGGNSTNGESIED